MIIKQLLFLSIPFVTTCCQHQEKENHLDNLTKMKKEFLLSILNQTEEEAPFQMNYRLKTVFFSNEIISLFGEFQIYDQLPHGSKTYEGKTFCKIDGKYKEIKLSDLFCTVAQKEFLRLYCETDLKSQLVSYFSNPNPLRTTLEYDDITAFIIDGKHLIVLFQPYVAGGFEDAPLHVKVPFELLQHQWDTSSPFTLLIQKTLLHNSYTSKWDGNF